MQSMYKVRLMRLNLLAAAVLLMLLALRTEPLSQALLLWLAAAWLAVTAALIEFSHRRPATLPWQLLPSLLLTGMLVSAPEQHALWLWVWPALLMLPQPGWMLLFSMALAGLSWWSLAALLGFEQTLFSGLVLLTLMLVGLARNRQLQPWEATRRARVRLAPDLPLWSAQQLAEDLNRERVRCRREEVHGELMLLQVPRHQLWPMARSLCRLIHGFENCYRLDHRTLAALLLSRDEEQAALRRRSLLQALNQPVKIRFATLEEAGSIGALMQRFEHQQQRLAIEPEPAHG